MEHPIDQHQSNISVTASAPGKVILHGEHSVVYGKLAVAASLGLRTNLTLTETSNDTLDLDFTDLKLQITFNIKDIRDILKSNGIPTSADYDFQRPENVNQTEILNRIDRLLSGRLSEHNENHTQALSTFLFLFSAIILPSNLELRGAKILVKSYLHLNSGMGSSASFAVTITAALYQYLKLRFNLFNDLAKVPKPYRLLTLNKDQSLSEEELKSISSWAFFAEKIIHGNPSGIDNSTCTYGSIVEFRRGLEPRPLQLKHKLSAILIDTGVPKNTKAQVEATALKKQLFPKIVANTLESMEVVCVKAIECLAKLSEFAEKNECVQKDFDVEYETLGQLIDINQNLLRILGVSHPSIDEICSILAAEGFHGKLTGAGGGGFVLAVVPSGANPEALKRVQETLASRRYSCWVLELGGVGVMIH